MNEHPESAEKISHHILPTSATMIGVCLTVIALFKAFNVGFSTIADEILGIDTFVFIVASLFSYISIKRRDSKKLEKLADNIFFAGLFMMVIVGVIILFQL